MQDEKIPLNVWKEIADGLDLIGIKKSWQTCRDKFNQMKSFFMSSMLPSKGKLGISKWSHYDKFCEIFEIPQDYIDVLNASEDGNNNIVFTNEEEEGKLIFLNEGIGLVLSCNLTLIDLCLSFGRKETVDTGESSPPHIAFQSKEAQI